MTSSTPPPASDTSPGRWWYEITPADAVNISLPAPGITGPLTEDGNECPWPWEPQQLVGVPLGQYHCPYCGEMCVAGVPHPDARDYIAIPADEPPPPGSGADDWLDGA